MVHHRIRMACYGGLNDRKQMSTHIEALSQWWDNAERGEAEPGDWIITHSPDDTNPAYIVEQAPHYPLSSKRQPYRILHRAPKPEPAWHNAVAVIAGHGGERQVFTPTVSGMWESEDFMLTPDEMTNPVPLIEQKVTDEMVGRIRELEDDYGRKYFASSIAARELLTVALNLDPA